LAYTLKQQPHLASCRPKNDSFLFGKLVSLSAFEAERYMALQRQDLRRQVLAAKCLRNALPPAGTLVEKNFQQKRMFTAAMSTVPDNIVYRHNELLR
jgi:hypothetical protein